MPRRIVTDGRDWPKEIEPTFNGYSIGKWIDTDHDGRYDVLETETLGLKGPRTYEGTGMPFHKDNQTVIKERLFLDKACENFLSRWVRRWLHEGARIACSLFARHSAGRRSTT